MHINEIRTRVGFNERSSLCDYTAVTDFNYTFYATFTPYYVSWWSYNPNCTRGFMTSSNFHLLV